VSLWTTKEVLSKARLDQKTVLVANAPPAAADTYQGQVWFDTAAKRLKVAYETAVTGENVGTGDGTTTTFYLANTPVKVDSETVYIDGVAKTRGTDYTIDYDTGAVTFTTPPASGAVITADYTYFTWRLAGAESLTEIPTRSHGDLQNVGADDHHAQLHASTHVGAGNDRITGIVPTKSAVLTNTLTVNLTYWGNEVIGATTLTLQGTHDVIVLANIQCKATYGNTMVEAKLYRNATLIDNSYRYEKLDSGYSTVLTLLYRFTGLSGSQDFRVFMKKPTGQADYDVELRTLVIIAVPV
jgi:hypothetical protein